MGTDKWHVYTTAGRKTFHGPDAAAGRSYFEEQEYTVLRVEKTRIPVQFPWIDAVIPQEGYVVPQRRIF